jgi:arylsulfatase A-like enzyme
MSQQRPHILLITADQLRKDALGCYGGEAVATPHLDALAAESTKFERAYTASPWCLPSRCALATGQYPRNNGAYSNFRDVKLEPDQPNIYNIMREGGYTVSHIGKCHYTPVPYGSTRPDETQPYDDFRDYYLSLGMDHLDLQDDKQVSVWFRDDYANELDAAGHLAAYRAAVWDRDAMKVFPFPAPAEWHPDAWVGRKAAEYIEAYDSDQPLFAWVSFSGPHFPFDSPAKYYDRVDMAKMPPRKLDPHEFDDPGRIHHDDFHGGPRSAIEGCGMAPGRATGNYSEDYWDRLRLSYFANVALLDDEVGRVLAAAKAHLGDNVLVIFTADHGEMLGNHGLWGKHNCSYEDVLNVPFLYRTPQASTPPTFDGMISLIDILPTMTDAAGIRISGLDGVPLNTQIERGGNTYSVSEGEGFLVISDGRYKFTRIRQPKAEYAELVDLTSDPNEFRNCYDDPAYAPVLARLQGAILDLYITSLIP